MQITMHLKTRGGRKQTTENMNNIQVGMQNEHLIINYRRHGQSLKPIGVYVTQAEVPQPLRWFPYT